MSDKTEKKYMKKSEIVTFGIGLFGVALMTGWMPEYTAFGTLETRVQRQGI